MSKTAVVLAGGGSRGAYQIGVWQALRELGIEFQIVTGTSVGALNGALMVQGDYERAKEVWSNLSAQTVLRGMFDEKDGGIDEKKIGAAFLKEVIEKGGADIAPLEQMLEELVDEERFRASSIDFALVTVEYPSLKPLELAKKDIADGMLAEYLLASAACFPAFHTREINGYQYIDGGYHDNLPINLALELGAETIIAVDLQSIGLTRRVKQTCKQITTIRCGWSLGSFLLFDKTLAQRNMTLGYLDAMKGLGRFDGYLYAFEQEGCPETIRLLYASMCELSAAAKAKDSGLMRALNRRLMRRMLRDFWGKTNERRPFTLARQLILSAEYCGEAFRLDPTQSYTLREFGAIILEASGNLAKTPMIPTSLSSIPKTIEEFKKQDKAHLVLLIAGRLEEWIRGTSSGADLQILAATFWKEFLGALYLLTLKNLLPSLV